MAAGQEEKWLQRMLVMVDIRDLRRLQNPKPHLSAIQQSVEKLLSSCDAKSLWAFKLFDSSLSSYRSRSVIEQNVGKWAGHVRFDSVQQTQTFISALKCLANAKIAECLQSSAHGRAESVAQSMQELIHDYVWEPLIFDNISSGKQDFFSKHGNFNLVVLFSSVPWTKTGFAEFAKDEKSCTDPPALSDEGLMEFFSSKFRSVNESFGSRDIHFCWIDIPPPFSQTRNCGDEISRGTISEAFKKMGWSFTSVDVVILASRLVPFSLIWPTIAYPRVSPTQCSTLAEVDLELEDVDGKSLVCRTCEVQWTELTQVKSLNLSKDESSCIAGMDFSLVLQKHFEKSCSGHMKIHVVLPFPKEKYLDLRNIVSSCVLLSGFSGKKKKCKTENNHKHFKAEGNVAREEMDKDLLGDEVLKRLQQQSEEFRCGKPAWQLLLVFLSHQNFMALVNISDKNNCSFGAILEPLTVHTAILHVLGGNFVFTPSIMPFQVAGFGGDCCEQLCAKTLAIEPQTDPNLEGQVNDNFHNAWGSRDTGFGGCYCEQVCIKTCETEPQEDPNLEGQVKDNFHNAWGSSEMEVNLTYNQSFPHDQEPTPSSLSCSGPKKSVPSGPISNKNSRENKSSKRGLDLQFDTWDSLYSATVGSSCKNSNIVLATKLEDRYFKGSCRQSKILRFLSRWMKKMSKKFDAGHAFDIMFNQALSNSHPVEINKAATDLVLNKTSQPVAGFEQYCLVSTALHSTSNASLSIEVGECDSAAVELDHEKAFAQSLDEKIQHGLSSKEVDLRALAQRLTDVVIQHVEVQLEAEQCSSTGVANARNLTKTSIYHEVTKLVLKTPKELAIKYKDCPLPFPSQLDNSDCSAVYTSEDKVREHELQVLFRMEILASNIAGSVEEKAKDKLIKEICKLLENIQFNLPGGIFGGESLNDFAGRVIASRYIDCLDTVIEKVFKDMEFYARDDSGDIFNQDKDADIEKNEDDMQGSYQNEFMATNSGEGRNAGQVGQSYCQISAVGDGQHPLKLSEDHRMSRKHSEKHLKIDDYQSRLKKAEANRERARRFAHFTSRARDLQRVWAPKQFSHITKKQSNSHLNQLKKKHVKVDKGYVIYETPMRSSKLRKYKDGKAVMVEREETKTAIDVIHETPYPRTNYRLGGTSDIVHETPYPIAKVQNHVPELRTMVVDYPSSRTASEHVTSGMESKLGSISRALFEKGKAF
ncbi:hypothetical protein KI387_025392 [Taxus chinensis]|uniref:Uncharacterized protein n=1 Tax=Taxus chinensis TaxID=29808 RepID=A0AA38L7N0_TAXCH|nr:hypothetical protein KI387_025392 [Taxus chinensis]